MVLAINPVTVAVVPPLPTVVLESVIDTGGLTEAEEATRVYTGGVAVTAQAAVIEL